MPKSNSMHCFLIMCIISKRTYSACFMFKILVFWKKKSSLVELWLRGRQRVNMEKCGSTNLNQTKLQMTWELEAFLRISWWYIQGHLSERGKHLKPKVSGMTVAKTWAGLSPNPMSFAFMFDQKNKHSVDISLENRFHNEAKFHQSWWVHLNVAIEYTLDKWKRIFSTWKKKKRSEWMQHFPELVYTYRKD